MATDAEPPARASRSSTERDSPYEPPEHIGEFYRKWNPELRSLSYQQLGSGTTFTLCYESQRYWIRKKWRTPNRVKRRESEWVVPDLEDGNKGSKNGISVGGFNEAMKMLVEYIRENHASFRVPPEINGWLKVPDTPSIEYQNRENTALVILEAHSDETYSVKAQGDLAGVVTVAAHLESRSDAVTKMKRWLKNTKPKRWGIRDAPHLDDEYSGFVRVETGMNDIMRFEDDTGYQVYVTCDEEKREEEQWCVRSSTGIEQNRLPAERVEYWVRQLVAHLEKHPNVRFSEQPLDIV